VIDPSSSRLNAFHAIGSAGADLYLGGSGDALRSSDSGRTWSEVLTGTLSAGYDYVAVAATAEDDVWLAGDSPFGGQWLHSADRGSSWQSVDVGSRSSSFGLWSIDRAHVLITTQDGQIRKTADGGATWTQVFNDPSLGLFALWGSAASVDLYAVGGLKATSATASGSGLILHSTDGGEIWERVLDGLACTLWSVSGTADGASVSAAGDCGTIAATTDHGATWSKSGLSNPTRELGIKGVWMSPTGASHFLVSGEGFYLEPFHAYDVCQSVDVDDHGAGTGGCEELPPYTFSSGSMETSTPLAIWGTSDDDIWATGIYLWHRR
jgi:hypothetical protein